MIRELDLVALARGLPEHGLKAGDVGTVVLLHKDQGYEVEFMTFGGDTVAVVTVEKDEMRPLRRDEIHHARLMETRP
jgi:hypothetical protein